ncbi:hypothetical protein BDP55DRAFT_673977 [Colletotrichum godetiae]|uniref:Uncharacterized protein n=1 Tax=Colletotrichum godetiae TaxID=1209918 RepID=A0AAJ0AE63_9PEZI|nr:uncharacterized protein BDP55DRAFT_673977 [Colletotrichum godetiae]KAK1672237.1 hypothetical protein BDP55DRAFT_673977 [Colletotrichum godetiae]
MACSPKRSPYFLSKPARRTGRDRVCTNSVLDNLYVCVCGSTECGPLNRVYYRQQQDHF